MPRWLRDPAEISAMAALQIHAGDFMELRSGSCKRVN
jgi:hypothetical protein